MLDILCLVERRYPNQATRSPERSQQCIIAVKFILESEANLDERQALRQRSWLKVVAQRGCVADAVGGRP